MSKAKTETGKRLASSLVAGWFLTISLLLVLEGGSFTSKAFGQERMVFVLVGTILLGGLIFCLARMVPFMERISLSIAALLLAGISFAYYPNLFYLIGILVALALVSLYVFSDGKKREKTHVVSEPPNKIVKIWIWILGVFFVIFVGGLTTLRYLNFFTPNFDFGLFCNMFYNMSEGFVPLVTSERDRLLSHFAVHISPIYYLLLPFYMLFPSPITLQIGQAVVLASGLVPLYLLAKELKLSRYAMGALAAMYVFFPALAGGTFYDLHENKFLTPLILWLCYAYERKKRPLMYVFALLICMVKEDAPVYVMFFAIYLILARKEYKHGPALLAGAFAYFLGAIYLLETFGEGVMSYRYANVVYGDGGLIGVIKTAIVNPLLIIKESFEPAKLAFILLMLAPLGFLPVLTRQLSSFILIAPMVLVNLIPDYQYQHSIFFQYTYGVSGFLFYLSAQNLAGLEQGVLANPGKLEWMRRGIYGVLVVTACCFFVAQLGNRTDYISYYKNTGEQRAAIVKTLDSIPKDASVQASTFFVARLARRDVIYEYPSQNKTDYIVLDLRYMTAEKAQSEMEKWEEKGYERADYTPGVIAVLKK